MSLLLSQIPVLLWGVLLYSVPFYWLSGLRQEAGKLETGQHVPVSSSLSVSRLVCAGPFLFFVACVIAITLVASTYAQV